MRVLTRAWQMLLKGSQEVPAAPSPIAAAEMALIRLATPPTCRRPTRRWSAGSSESRRRGAGRRAAAGGTGELRPRVSRSRGRRRAAGAGAARLRPGAAPGRRPLPRGSRTWWRCPRAPRNRCSPDALESNSGWCASSRGASSSSRRRKRPRPGGAAGAASCSTWTGQRWIVAVDGAPSGGPTGDEGAAADEVALSARGAGRDPLVRPCSRNFPGAEIGGVRDGRRRWRRRRWWRPPTSRRRSEQRNGSAKRATRSIHSRRRVKD